MADFRRWFYALALVALLAGFTVPVSAQVCALPVYCQRRRSSDRTRRRLHGTRGRHYTELHRRHSYAGRSGSSAGKLLQSASNTNITSRLLAAILYDEALLIVDEPHSAVQPTRPILNCGASGAPDSGASGPGVCSIVSDGNPLDTYNGVANA